MGFRQAVPLMEPPSSTAWADGGIGIGHAEVDDPVTGHAFGHESLRIHHPGLVIAVDVERAIAGALHLHVLERDAEDCWIERAGRLDVERHQFEPGRSTVLAEDLEAIVLVRLPGDQRTPQPDRRRRTWCRTDLPPSVRRSPDHRWLSPPPLSPLSLLYGGRPTRHRASRRPRDHPTSASCRPPVNRQAWRSSSHQTHPGNRVRPANRTALRRMRRPDRGPTWRGPSRWVHRRVWNRPWACVFLPAGRYGDGNGCRLSSRPLRRHHEAR